jgi:hypothetical protein
MSSTDQIPRPNTPGTDRIKAKANNRLGAVFSSLYSFWIARQVMFDRNARSGGGVRKDTYSLIFFDSAPTSCIENNFTGSPDELLTAALQHNADGGTNFTRALKRAQDVMTSHWSTERYVLLTRITMILAQWVDGNRRTPVVIFLSDGLCDVSDECIYDICRAASQQGFVRYQCYFPTTINGENVRKPLSFHTVSFGRQNTLGQSTPPSSSFLASSSWHWSITRPSSSNRMALPSSLTRMADIAQEVQKTVPQNVMTVNIPSSYTEALDTVRDSNDCSLRKSNADLTRSA